MKIDLVKINIGDSYKYKFNRYEPCCDEILDNPCIDFTNYNLTEETPDNEPRYCLTSINSYDDVDWEDNYPIKFCPHCGAPVVETARAFGCSGWKKGCKFAIWKDDRFITSLGKKVSYEMVKILLEHGKVGFRGCVSKRGNKFSAYFYYEKDEKTGRYNWRLEFIDTNPPQA